jgi:hypothetical protein
MRTDRIYSLDFDVGLVEAERKVKAISGLHVDAQPSSLGGIDLPLYPETGAIACLYTGMLCVVQGSLTE